MTSYFSFICTLTFTPISFSKEMVSANAPETPPPMSSEVGMLAVLCDEADRLMGCIYERHMSGSIKRDKIEESREKLVDLRDLLFLVSHQRLTSAEFRKYDTARGRFEYLREAHLEREDYVWGGPHGPGRTTNPVRTLDFESSELYLYDLYNF